MDARQGRVRPHRCSPACPVRRQGQGSAFPARCRLRHRSVGARAARAPGNEAVRLGVGGDPPWRAPGPWVRWPRTPLTHLALSQLPTCEPHIRGWGAGEEGGPGHVGWEAVCWLPSLAGLREDAALRRACT